MTRNYLVIIIFTLEIVVLNILVTLHKGSAQESVNSCYRKQTDQFQVAFIYDRSASYAQFGKQFVKEILPQFARKLSYNFPGTEYAITAFADYTAEQHPKLVPRRTRRQTFPINEDKTTGCYQRIQSFTARLQDIRTKFKTIQVVTTGGSGESSLSAIYFTIADQGLKWREAVINPGDLPMDTPSLYKMIVLLTEESSTESLAEGDTLSDLVGDGTDDCTKTKVPTPVNIAQILADNNVTGIVAVLNRVPARPEVKQVWDEYFTQFGIPSRIVMRKVNETGSSIAEEIDKSLKEIIGEECIIQMEDEDPPAYNTLGF